MEALKELCKNSFLIGAAVSPRSMKSHDKLIRAQFSTITAENAMKPESVMRSLGEYDFRLADEFIAYGKKNGIKMRGHTLAWHNQTPAWFFRDGAGVASRETMLSRLFKHIDVMAEHFPECYQWDVVNEAVSDKPEEYLRLSQWTQTVGDDFIAEAFSHAASCLPKGSLIYNDYNACLPEKRERIIRLITDMKDRGIPVDGVGLQGHWNIEVPNTELIEEAICAYRELGLRIQFTELDMSVKGVMSESISGLTRPSDEQRRKQISRWEEVFRVFRKYSADIDSVTFWGAADDVTWLDKLHRDGFSNMPLLFADCAHAKPEFDKACMVMSE